MARRPAIQRTYTVDDQFEHLSVRCPVQVWTQGFARHPHEPPSTPGQLCIVGRYDYWEYLPAVQPHDHEHFELSFVIDGRAQHHTEYGTFPIRAGDVLTIAPGEVHGVTDLKGVHIINCAYLQDWLLYNLADVLADACLTALFLPTALHTTVHRLRVPQWHISGDTFAECLVELEHLARECVRPEPFLLYMKASLFKLMTTLTRSYPQETRADILVSVRPDVSEAINDIELCVVAGAPFNEAALARRQRLAPDYFSRVFRQGTGSSPMAYYQRRRVQHACWQLLNTSQSITDIAHALGYCHSAHFCTAFKRIRGLTPLAYRQRYGV